jgi:uracil-DNA glycosylase family 4
MTGEHTVEIDRENLRTELCNWLRLLEISGTEHILMKQDSYPGARETCVGSARSLAKLEEEVASCTRCGLHSTRSNTVYGEGSPSSRLMFIGEGPGRDEDLSGRPFVGKAGMLLTKIIGAMGLTREDVYITNIVKCRPPSNRNPELDEISECLPFLEKQIELIQPEIICTLGVVATQTITGTKRGIGAMRGRIHDYMGINVIPTFHPAACLRYPANKKLVWEDIKEVMKFLDLPIRGVMRNGPGKSKH